MRFARWRDQERLPDDTAKALQRRTIAYQNAAARLRRDSPLCVYAIETFHDPTQIIHDLT
jgi:hypothetical protein